MMRRRLALVLSAMFVVLLAGCAAGYRDRLRDYQRNAPPSFDRQTIDWLSRAETPTASAPITSASLALAGEATTTDTEGVFTELVAGVADLDPAGLPSRLRAMSDTAQRERALAGTLDWETLNLAVAAANPAVRAAREMWQATLQQFMQADYLELLVAQFRAFTRYLDPGAGEPMNKGMAQQFFPYPATIALKGELVRRQARLARIEWEKMLRDALVTAGQLFYQYQYLWRAEATTRENIALVERLLDVVVQRTRTGSTSQADLLKVQTDLERQRNMLADLAARKRAAAADLNALLDRAAEAPLGRPAEADLPLIDIALDALTTRALAGRQEVALASTRVERAAAAIRLGEVMNRPLASQGYSNFERTMMPEASPGASAMPFGTTAKAIDRPAYAQAEAYLAEMRRMLAAEESMLEAMRAETRALVRSWLQDLDIARREAALIREIVLPQNRSAYDASLSAYSSGSASFLDLLDAERALLAARLELDAARRDLNQTLVRHAAVTGRLTTD